MLRAMGFAATVAVASSFKFVSQTFQGNMTTNTSIPGAPALPSPTLATANFGLDMENVRMRNDDHILIDMKQYNITTMTWSSKIFDVSSKRATSYTKTVVTGPAPSNHTACVYSEFPQMKDKDTVKGCLETVAALAHPAGTEEGLLKFELNMDIPAAGTEASDKQDIYTDSNFVIKKLVADMDIKDKNISTHTELINVNSKLGAPDDKDFVIPADWGTCTPSPMPFDTNSMKGPLKLFLQCVGLAVPSKTEVVIV